MVWPRSASSVSNVMPSPEPGRAASARFFACSTSACRGLLELLVDHVRAQVEGGALAAFTRTRFIAIRSTSVVDALLVEALVLVGVLRADLPHRSSDG